MLIEDIENPAVVMATRDGFGKGLVEVGEKDKNVWALSADVTKSSRAHWFAEKFPSRFVQVGVAEQNLAGVGAGIASEGKTVFISSFGAFSPGRNWDQIRMSICYNNVPVIIHASHTGIIVGPDGASHQILEDIAMVRALPNMSVVAPSDMEQARKSVHALHEHKKPGYLRTTKQKMPVITTPETPFEIGNANLYREGDDVAIFACGPMVYYSLLAARQLKKHGISAAVVDMHSIKPIDRGIIERMAKKTGLLVSVEDHQIHGGMGSAVAEELSSMKTDAVLRIHGIDNRFCESGTAGELLKKYKLDSEGIIEVVKEEMGKNKG